MFWVGALSTRHPWRAIGRADVYTRKCFSESMGSQFGGPGQKALTAMNEFTLLWIFASSLFPVPLTYQPRICNLNSSFQNHHMVLPQASPHHLKTTMESYRNHDTFLIVRNMVSQLICTEINPWCQHTGRKWIISPCLSPLFFLHRVVHTYFTFILHWFCNFFT